MPVRRSALGTALAAGAFALAGCGMVNMPGAPTAPTMPAKPTAAGTAPAAPAMPSAPNAPQMPQMPQMPAAAQQAQQIMSNAMSATLTGASEVPPNASSGSGQATIKLDGTTLSWSIAYSGLTGPVTGAHFHGPAAPSANAGVVLPFAGSLASPIVGSKQLTAAEIVQLKSGLWYVNLHTSTHPGGEIRGQVK